MYLEKIPQILESNFETSWLTSLKFNTKKEIENSSLKLVEKFTCVAEEISINLHLSVITGEYVSVKKEVLLEEISKAKKILTAKSSEIFEQVTPSNKAITEIILSKISNTFEFSLKLKLSIIFDEYELFLIRFEQKLNGGNAQILFQAKKVNEDILKFETIVSLDRFFDVFTFNIQLAEIDHKLSINRSSLFLQDLLLLKEILLDIIDKKKYPLPLQHIYFILQDKCNFLIKKIIEESDENIYLIDTDIHNVSDSKSEILYFKHFDDFQEIAYENKTHLIELSRESDKIILEKLQGASLSFSNYFILVKYFKEISKCTTELETLISEFEHINFKHINIEHSRFNLRAFQISLNYLKNNLYSLFLKSTDLDAISVKQKFSELKGLQSSTTNKNYFPYLKFSEWCCNYLTTSFESQKIESAELVIDLLNESVKALRENFKWCQQNSFIPFQLPFEESLITPSVNPLDIKIFVASSFVRPVNYDKVESEIIEIEAKLINFKNLNQNLKILTSKTEKIESDLRKANEEIKDNIRDAKNEAKEAQKNNLQILSIFAAIVVFATGTIQVFKSATNYKQAMIFMLIFGYCLCLFVLLIWFISYYKKDKTKSILSEVNDNIPNTHRIILYSLGFGLLLNFVFLFSPLGNENINGINQQDQSKNKSDVKTTEYSTDTLNNNRNSKIVKKIQIKPISSNKVIPNSKL